jgi:uncharacterized DUF497 family protein
MVQFGEFEWDPDKAEVNFKKHRVSFFEAATVFQDTDVVIEPDPVHSDEE